MTSLTGCVAIVTGASSGIGKATALRFAAEGARVVLCARSADRLHEITIADPSKLFPFVCNVGLPEEIDRLFDYTESAVGTCDVLVNNAGTVNPKVIEQTSVEEWDEMFAINTRSAFLTSRRALPHMKAKGRGAIINVASISGVAGPQKFPGFASYCASKAALISFSEALAVEVKEHGVRVNAVSPGSVDTAMLKRASESLVPDMTAAEVAEVILFLASDRSRPIQGQNLHVYSA
ncbi:MAG TPA: SDR family oxidoreductase [Thermoanaerobaculia bacterium]|nr:SDR family oxidoreductase [Thermoanaerobaculia bacterium]